MGGEVEEEEGRCRERETARWKMAMEEQGEEDDARCVVEVMEGGRVSGELVRLEQKLEMLCKSYRIQR